MALVDYPFTSVFNEWNQQATVKDPEIIEWCKNNNGIWVHADDKSKKEHAKIIVASQIRMLWVYRKHGRMTGKEQLRIIAWRIEDVIAMFKKNNAHPYLKLRTHGDPQHPGVHIEPYSLSLGKG